MDGHDSLFVSTKELSEQDSGHLLRRKSEFGLADFY